MDKEAIEPTTTQVLEELLDVFKTYVNNHKLKYPDMERQKRGKQLVVDLIKGMEEDFNVNS
jgi:hypothetical protein